jgi:hypothetical protein
VLVEDRGQTAHRAGEPSERRRAIAVQVQDVDLLAIDDLEERGQRRGIELGSVQILDIDPERVERLFGEISLAQADERDVEAGPVEAWDHPREQAFDAVHARPFPPQVIAHLEDVQRARWRRVWAGAIRTVHAPAFSARLPTMRAGTPTAIACGGTSAFTTAPAPTIASSPTTVPSSTLTPAPSQAPAPIRTPDATRPCSSTGLPASFQSWSPPIT